MAELSRLTDRESVLDAVQEFDALGEEAFLDRYGYSGTVDYYLVLDGRLYGSKAIVGVAFGKQYPELGPLARKEFSGGLQGAGSALKRLGFEVKTPAELDPPRLGAEFTDRHSVYRKYGGDMQGLVTRFPGDKYVNVFDDADNDDFDEGAALTQPFVYRDHAPHVNPGPTLDNYGLLETARREGLALRYWRRQLDGRFRFATWATVVGRSWITIAGDYGDSHHEIRWVLQSVPSSDPDVWPASVQDAFDTTLSDSDDTGTPVEAQLDASYGQLIQCIDDRGQGKPERKSHPRVDYRRSAAVRQAVLQRSGGRCESFRCTGMPPNMTRKGEPILDVDHVLDLALGGDDHPLNAVALCPNCHAAKTRGPDTEQWRLELLTVASEAHHRSIATE